jgi:hypothetical protein
MIIQANPDIFQNNHSWRYGQGAKKGMTIPERIKNFLREHEGTAYCDDCLAGELGLPKRQEAQQATSSFGGTGNFIRSKGLCHICGKDKQSTRFSK